QVTLKLPLKLESDPDEQSRQGPVDRKTNYFEAEQPSEHTHQEDGIQEVLRFPVRVAAAPEQHCKHEQYGAVIAGSRQKLTDQLAGKIIGSKRTQQQLNRWQQELPRIPCQRCANETAS